LAIGPDLEVACSVPGFSPVARPGDGIDLALERAGKALVMGRDYEMRLVSMPGCATETILPPFPQILVAGITYGVTAGGDVLYRVSAEPGRAFLLKQAGKAAVPLKPPADADEAKDWSPILSDDGVAVAWQVSRYEKGLEPEHFVKVRDLATGDERSIRIGSGRQQYELVGANVASGAYALSEFPKKVMVVNDAGETTWGPEAPSAVQYIYDNVRRVAGGWVAWDATQTDDGHYRVQWSTAKAKGQLEYTATRFDSISVDPSGELIAISFDPRDYGRTARHVAIMRTLDGSIVYRRAYPGTKRIRLVFLDSNHLVIDGETGADVLRLPATLAAASAGSALPPVEAHRPNEPATKEAEMLDEVRKLATLLGLNLEKIGADARERILGQWYWQCAMCDAARQKAAADGVAPPGAEVEGVCGTSFWWELRADGSAATRTKDQLHYTIEDDFIEVTGADEHTRIFQLSGNFYIRSGECIFAKLVRGPAVALRERKAE